MTAKYEKFHVQILYKLDVQPKHHTRNFHNLLIPDRRFPKWVSVYRLITLPITNYFYPNGVFSLLKVDLYTGPFLITYLVCGDGFQHPLIQYLLQKIKKEHRETQCDRRNVPSAPDRVRQGRDRW